MKNPNNQSISDQVRNSDRGMIGRYYSSGGGGGVGGDNDKRIGYYLI